MTKNIQSNELSALNSYLREIEKVPLLNPSEEYDLALKAKRGDENAKNRMIEANLRFVISIAKQYQNRGIPLEDLIAEGNLGLLTALDKFEPELGNRFISYGVWWIRQSIAKAIGTYSRMIRLPMNKNTELMAIKQAKVDLENGGYENPTNSDIAIACGMTEKKVETILRSAMDVSSLDAPISEGEGTSVGDFIESEDDKPEECVIDKALKESVFSILE
ncbi:MAG: RNA polymerase sigma factor RpoD/SigA, partial [Sphaerochaetaceae bacterium]|nr:RNA polymerase sigma factor RpoD/SigA [Sphaerochaetaceae bacterium]